MTADAGEGDSSSAGGGRLLSEITFRTKSFDELTVGELHDLLRLRTEVFVVEQQCPYPELDGRDPSACHLLGSLADELVAYARWYSHGEAHVIGRVVTRHDLRGRGIGRELMTRALEAIGNREIKLSAQVYLEGFYRGLGFVTTSAPYDDLGILHVDMLRKPTPETSC